MLEKTAELIRTRLAEAFDRWQPSVGKKTKKNFAALCQQERGVSCTPQAVQGWFKTGRMDKAWLLVVGKILDTNLLSDAEMAFDQDAKSASSGARAYPVLPKGPARRGDGQAVEFGDADASPHAFFLQIKDDSMHPEFRHGDRVLIDPDVTPQPGQYVAAKSGRQQMLFRKYRLHGVDGSGKEIFGLVALNEDHPSLRSDEQAISVIGTARELRRKFLGG